MKAELRQLDHVKAKELCFIFYIYYFDEGTVF